ncbi:MAG: hypothetical protein HC914_19805 [Chloroflexaceae bacterium]|nr:hypothetical protein [Chloroflexaceae bacterium]
MTAPSLGRLLISHITLRGPELNQLYTLIAAHPGINYADLVSRLVINRDPDDTFGLAEAPLREALNFLLVARLVDQHGSSRFRASFQPAPLLPDTPFSLLLLHHIRQHEDERQRAPALMYTQLVAEDAIATSAAVIRDQMERSMYRDLFAWTGEKVGFWVHLFSYLGLVRRMERSTDVLIVPQPNFVLTALGWAQQARLSRSLAACLHVIDDTFFCLLYRAWAGASRVGTNPAGARVARSATPDPQRRRSPFAAAG